MPTEILTEQAIANIRFDLANTKPAPAPMGLFRQHCENLLSEHESLQSQLEQLRAELAEEKRLRAELKQIAQIGISEVSSVGTVLKDNAVIDFRSRAIELCKSKAAAWEESGKYGSALMQGKASAAKEIVFELEKL